MTQRKFLVVADDTPEFQVALRFACRRARSTGGHVALLRVIEPEYFEHWSGVREEIDRQAREEAEAILQKSAELVVAESDLPPEFLINACRQCPRRPSRGDQRKVPTSRCRSWPPQSAVADSGPLVTSLAKEG